MTVSARRTLQASINKTRRALMTVSGHDQRPRERWRLVPTPVLTRVLAVIGAVALATVVLSGCGSSGSAGPTHRATATVPVGKRPYQVAVDPSSHTVYVTNDDDGTITVIDASTRAVTATVPAGQHPAGPIPGTAAPPRPAPAPAPAGQHPHGVALDPSSHTSYVTNYFDNTVSVIDTSTRAVTATVPVGKYPYGVALEPGSH